MVPAYASVFFVAFVVLALEYLEYPPLVHKQTSYFIYYLN